MPSRTWALMPATRTMKNSSRLLAEIDRNRTPLKRGMAGIDRLLQHPAIEVQPGKLPVNEAFGAFGHRRTGPGIHFFFFSYNGLRGFHKVSIHPKAGGRAIPETGGANHVFIAMTFHDIDVPSVCAVKMQERPGGSGIAQQFQPPAPGVTGRPSRKASAVQELDSQRTPHRTRSIRVAR